MFTLGSILLANHQMSRLITDIPSITTFSAVHGSLTSRPAALHKVRACGRDRPNMYPQKQNTASIFNSIFYMCGMISCVDVWEKFQPTRMLYMHLTKYLKFCSSYVLPFWVVLLMDRGSVGSKLYNNITLTHGELRFRATTACCTIWLFGSLQLGISVAFISSH